MLPRTVSSFLASVLLVVQLVSAPFSHAGVVAPGDGDCAGMAMQHQPSMAGNDADADCGHMSIDAREHCKHTRQAHHSHASCTCPCGHAPALATVRLIILEPTPPVEATGPLATATFDPPFFELLRPPK